MLVVICQGGGVLVRGGQEGVGGGKERGQRVLDWRGVLVVVD